MAGIVSPIDRYVEPVNNFVECFRQEFEYRDTDIPWFLQRAAVRLGVDVRSLSWSIQKAVYKGDLARQRYVIECESNQLMLPLFLSLQGGLPTDENKKWVVPDSDSFEIQLEDSSLGLPFAYNRVSGIVGTFADNFIGDIFSLSNPGNIKDFSRVYFGGTSESPLYYIEGRTPDFDYNFVQPASVRKNNSLRAVHVVHSGGLAKVLANFALFGYSFEGDYQQSVYFEYMLITANQ